MRSRRQQFLRHKQQVASAKAAHTNCYFHSNGGCKYGSKCDKDTSGKTRLFHLSITTVLSTIYELSFLLTHIEVRVHGVWSLEGVLVICNAFNHKKFLLYNIYIYSPPSPYIGQSSPITTLTPPSPWSTDTPYSRRANLRIWPLYQTSPRRRPDDYSLSVYPRLVCHHASS